MRTYLSSDPTSPTSRACARGRLLSGWLPLVPMALWALGCGGTDPTELVPGITTQIRVPANIKGVGYVAQVGGSLVTCDYVDATGGVAILPGTLGVLQGEEPSYSGPVTITVLGFEKAQADFQTDCLTGNIKSPADGEVRVLRKRRTTYIEEKILYLPMPLKESCAGVDCDEQETCVGGRCEPIEFDSASLVEYNDRLIFGNTNTCFSVSSCLDSSVTFPASPIEESSCTFELLLHPDLPTPPAGHLNVQLVYASGNVEALDLDDKEGFVFDNDGNWRQPNPSLPMRFRLADNLCQSNYHQAKIKTVSASAVCPAKTPLQPICSGDLADIQEGNAPNVSDAMLTLDECPLTPNLEPTESALYVLMDRSTSMGDNFGDTVDPEDTKLDEVIELVLSNPIARRTRVAFTLLPTSDNPSPATYCDGGNPDGAPYETPEIGFGVVDDVSGPIVQEIEDESNVLPDDPTLFLDSAMTGAYSALSALSPTVSEVFNRRALLIVGNRDFESHCSDAPPAYTLAADAFGDADKPIHTYVTVLADGNDSGAIADATDIAIAGGTDIINGVYDDEEALRGAQSVVNDLGSCVYDDAGYPWDQITLEDTKLSYIDPVTLDWTFIEHNPDCDEDAAETVDGWNHSAPTVRICGQSCADLRTVLGKELVWALSVPVPITVHQPCE